MLVYTVVLIIISICAISSYDSKYSLFADDKYRTDVFNETHRMIYNSSQCSSLQLLYELLSTTPPSIRLFLARTFIHRLNHCLYIDNSKMLASASVSCCLLDMMHFRGRESADDQWRMLTLCFERSVLLRCIEIEIFKTNDLALSQSLNIEFKL